MHLSYSFHAIQRMKQRGITDLEVRHVLEYPARIKKTHRIEAHGIVNHRAIKVVYVKKDNYLRIITVM